MTNEFDKTLEARRSQQRKRNLAAPLEPRTLVVRSRNHEPPPEWRDGAEDILGDDSQIPVVDAAKLA